MSRITFRVNTGVNSWSCAVACGQCTYVRANGAQCRNRVCHGSPYCWIHNKLAYGLRARPSTIPGAGKGLFASRAFVQDDWICPMTCESITQECLENRYPGDTTAPYAEQEDDGNITDCACSRGIGSQANAKFRADGLVRAVRFHNAVAVTRYDDNEVSMGIWLQARRAIPQGNEIFLWYGTNEGPNAYRLQNNHTTRRRNMMDTRPC